MATGRACAIFRATGFARSFFVAQGTGAGDPGRLGALECRRIGVRVLKGLKVATLLRDGDAVVGAILFEKDGSPVSVRAGAVVVALGGSGAGPTRTAPIRRTWRRRRTR